MNDDAVHPLIALAVRLMVQDESQRVECGLINAPSECVAIISKANAMEMAEAVATSDEDFQKLAKLAGDETISALIDAERARSPFLDDADTFDMDEPWPSDLADPEPLWSMLTTWVHHCELVKELDDSRMANADRGPRFAEYMKSAPLVD
jgi:hypothetical protein